MDDQVTGWCAKLTDAVNISMNPGVVHSGRLQAYQLCEHFKESAPYSDCLACGLQLSSINNSTIIRHFGLQLLENCVRFRWNSASPSEKLFLKEQVLQMFQNGTHDLLEEQMCVKDGLSRIMVEMIKREWPQQWPSLMSEFNSLCAQGETQTELVLLVLLRLVEDVVTFQSLQTSRRRDVLQALTANMAELFAFMLQLLTHHVDKYRNLQSASSMRVAQAVLLTLTGYVDWVNSQHIFAENNTLLKALYSLLNIPQLKLAAVEVLQLVVNRKGKPEERCPLLVLFSSDAIKTILMAAENSCGIGLNEENYIFLKRLCQVLIGLGGQLCVLLGSDIKDIGQPKTFPDFLQVLLAFLSHPSLQLCSMVVPLFSAFFRHEHISKDSTLLSMVPQILKILALKAQKVGYPSMDDSPTCAYSVLDYDSDEEFSHNFSIHRLHQMELVRLITGCCPLLIFRVASDWFEQLIASPLQFEAGRDICTAHSPSYIQWDALTCFFESVLSKLFQSDSITEITPQLVNLLQMALAYQIEDPAILSCVLSSISTLFPVIKEKPELVSAFLDKIFSAAVFSLPGQTKKTRTRPVQNVRRHACSALVKICRDNSEFMVNFFDPLYDRIKLLNKDQEQLTQLEKSTLNEVLILLSNEFKNIDKQSALIQEILSPVRSVWMSDAMKNILGSIDEFLKHIGLLEVSACPAQEDREGANRATILGCVATMMAVIKRSKSPQDPQEAQAGGFFVPSFHSAGMVCRDPCFQHVLPLLGNVLVLMRTMNSIWAPENKGKIPADHLKVYDIPENDRNAVLGITQPSLDNNELPANRSTIEKIQSFLCTAQDHCCHVLASACENMGYELYTSADFFSHLTDALFWLVSNAPDNRLRPVIRVFMKSLVQHCPVDCQDQALLPILNCLCDFMLQRLSCIWDIINNQQETGKEPENKESNQESQEILDEMFLRLVTRDYLDLLSTVFKKKADNIETVTLQEENEMKVDMMESDTMASSDSGQKTSESELSELGMKILQQESLCKSIVMCIYSALSWNDTQTCIKSLNICWPIFQQIVAKPLVPDAAKYLFICLLHGLQVHGQHEGCMAWLVQKTFQHYEVLRPRFDILQEVMLQVPGVTSDALKVFDRRFIFKEENKKATSDKSKRDNFKRLISGIIGKPIGQMFKREVIIRNLAPMNKPTKQRTANEKQENADLGLAVLFADA